MTNQKTEFDVRGTLAASLVCWHRLTGEEAKQLVELYEAIQAQLNQQVALVEKCMIAMNENADKGQAAERERDAAHAKLRDLWSQEPAATVSPYETNEVIWNAGYQHVGLGSPLYAGPVPAGEGQRAAMLCETIKDLDKALVELAKLREQNFGLQACISDVLVTGAFSENAQLRFKNLLEGYADPRPAAAPAVPDGWKPADKPMTSQRALYFMERFKREEKLLGHHEQSAVDYVIAMLAAAPQLGEQQ